MGLPSAEEGTNGEPQQNGSTTVTDSDGAPVAAGVSVLACLRCSKLAKLQCPKCLELKLPRGTGSFCSQDCFKAAWSHHKSVHSEVSQSAFKALAGGSSDDQISEFLSQGWLFCIHKGQRRSARMPVWDWTGPLLPYPISPRRLVPDHIPRPEWASDGSANAERYSELQNRVEIKTPAQIEKMRAACKLGREALDAAARAIRPGVTTDEIDDIVHQVAILGGGYPSPLNYHFFPKSCCTSVNEVICHGIPDARCRPKLFENNVFPRERLAERRLEDGDIVDVDVTVWLDGYHGDLNETFLVGNVDKASQQLVQVTYECLDKAIAIVKPGVRYREIGEVINRHASLNGFSVVKSYCGHGIGELFHCAPNIPHYARNKAVGMMKAGQTFTIEPMINAGAWQDRMWPDGWTAVTADGKRSAQFEHTLLVTDSGCEVLTARLPTSPDVFPWLR